jgi:hypothetical protein
VGDAGHLQFRVMHRSELQRKGRTRGGADWRWLAQRVWEIGPMGLSASWSAAQVSLLPSSIRGISEAKRVFGLRRNWLLHAGD